VELSTGKPALAVRWDPQRGVPRLDSKTLSQEKQKQKNSMEDRKCS
jgi:hypothetical protein